MSLLNRDPAERPSALAALKKTYMFSSMTQSHEAGQKLPSIRPAFLLAVKVHAFENRSLANDDVDAVLNMKQGKKLGTPLPELLRENSRSSRRSSCSTASTRSSVHAIGSPQISADLSNWNGSFTNEGSWSCSV
jgi:hypothetical protein